MKTKNKLQLACLLTLAILGIAILSVHAGLGGPECKDDHKTVGPTVQSPECDNGCNYIVCSPSYDLAITTPNYTGYKYTGAGPGTVAVTFTSIRYTCEFWGSDHLYQCDSTALSTTNWTRYIYEPTHFVGCGS